MSFDMKGEFPDTIQKRSARFPAFSGLMFKRFYADFGPLNLAMVYKYCLKVYNLLTVCHLLSSPTPFPDLAFSAIHCLFLSLSPVFIS